MRLPTVAEAGRILQAANGQASDSEQGKAKRNLIKSIDRAWKFVSETRTDAIIRVAMLNPNAKAHLDGAMSKDPQRMPRDQEITDILKVLLRVCPELKHLGPDRYVNLTAEQVRVFDETWLACKSLFNRIVGKEEECTSFIEEVFSASGTWKPQEYYTRWARESFRLARDAIELFRNDFNNRIKVDDYCQWMQAGALSNREMLQLAKDFFDGPLEKRVSTLAHESTHAIQNSRYVTNDDGGYIGTTAWEKAELEVRMRNASHYQFVIDRLLRRPRPEQKVELPDVVRDAYDIAQRAWIQALREYGFLAEYHRMQQPTDNDKKHAEIVCKLFGLPAAKNAAQPTVSLGDLADSEHKVRKLAAIQTKVNTAHDTLTNNPNAGAITADAILLQVVRAEGAAIRTANNPQKTVAAMKVLAELKNNGANQGNMYQCFCNGRYDKV